MLLRIPSASAALLLLMAGYAPSWPGSSRPQQVLAWLRPGAVQSEVAVAFSDDVTEGQARAFIRRSGYEVIDVRFTPVIVWAATDTAMTADEGARLRSARGVLLVEEEDVGAQRAHFNRQALPGEAVAFRPVSVRAPGFTATSVSRFNVTVVLEPWVSAYHAEGVFRGTVQAFVRKVTKRPNTITIRVNRQWSADAVRWLESQPEVAGVSFLNTR